MDGTSTFSVLVASLAVLFWVIGMTHLVGPRFLRDAFEKWNYGESVRIITGCLEIAVALMLAHPELRGWGIALAGLVMFGAVITLLSHEQYLCAIPSVALMLALIPATFAVPHANTSVHFATIHAAPSAQLADNSQAL
jgi:uncharacterized membrane protein